MLTTKQYFEMLSTIFGELPPSSSDITVSTLDDFFSATCKHQGLDPESPYAKQLKEALRNDLTQEDERVFANGRIAEGNQLLQAAQEIEDAIHRRSIPLPEKPFLGFFNTGLVNAQAIRVPGAPHCIIAIDSGTFRFFHGIADLISLLLPKVQDDGGFEFRQGDDDELKQFWNEEIEKKPNIVQALVSMVCSYMSGQEDSTSLPPFDNPGRFHIASNLAAGSRLLLVAHEYGHVVCGHLTASSQARFQALNGSEVEVVRPTWDQEYEADWHGANFATGAMLAQIRQLEWAVMGIDNFFTTLHLFEMCRDILSCHHLYSSEHLPGCSDSHPPIINRRDRVFFGFRQAFGNDLEVAEKLCRFIRFGVRCLFESAMPSLKPIFSAIMLELLRKKSIQPSKIQKPSLRRRIEQHYGEGKA